MSRTSYLLLIVMLMLFVMIDSLAVSLVYVLRKQNTEYTLKLYTQNKDYEELQGKYQEKNTLITLMRLDKQNYALVSGEWEQYVSTLPYIHYKNGAAVFAPGSLKGEYFGHDWEISIDSGDWVEINEHMSQNSLLPGDDGEYILEAKILRYHSEIIDFTEEYVVLAKNGSAKQLPARSSQ